MMTTAVIEPANKRLIPLTLKKAAQAATVIADKPKHHTKAVLGIFLFIITACGTLPASPSAGNTVIIKNIGAGTVTVGRNGSKIEGVTDDGDVLTGGATQLVYVDSTNGWKEI